MLPSALPFNVPPIAVEYAMYAIALFGFRIFDPIPLARQAVIQQLHSGILVLDSRGQVASLNPAAERILGVTASRARGQPVRELLPACPDGQLADAEETEIELSLPAGHSLERTPGTLGDGLEAGQAVRHYTLEVSPLKDWRGLAVGRLLLLHDVSEQKRAQAQILEQQQVVATLQERERLARELHDNLGQVLGYVSLQAQAIRKRARDGDLAAIEPQLTRLAEVAQEAHQEIRESILGLRSSPAEPWSFFSALKQHLDACREHYGLRTELVIPSGLRQDVLGPGAGVQLLRVIQEAVANARKHGRAQCVQVSFGLEDKSVRITVADDGCGFDLEQLEGQAEGHYGLSFMRERMTQIGGSLMLDSRPGSGTQVTLRAPVRSDINSC
jgi:PAS domain S-box-containing protein